MQASCTACVMVSSLSFAFELRHFWRFPGKCSTTWSTQRLPEWPSSTQKPAMRCPSGDSSSISRIYLSSCTSLLLCQQATPAVSCNLPTRTSFLWEVRSILLWPAARFSRQASMTSWAWPYSPSSCCNCISRTVLWLCTISFTSTCDCKASSASLMRCLTVRAAITSSRFRFLILSSRFSAVRRCTSDICECRSKALAEGNFRLQGQQMCLFTSAHAPPGPPLGAAGSAVAGAAPAEAIAALEQGLQAGWGRADKSGERS
mmetsp:Transcript_91829/g.205141  ORF Transcript_91829/g.205141 Transcript_91829/m.205141 type:complete len:260 (+) Transcript_91829:740-1519(+)